MGLSPMLKHRQQCAEFGSRLVVVATDPAVLRPIQLTGLEEVLTIAPTVQAVPAIDICHMPEMSVIKIDMGEPVTRGLPVLTVVGTFSTNRVRK